MRFISRKGLLALIACVAIVTSLGAFAEATLTTDKTKYAVGETMVISGSGFSANAHISVSVLKPDHVTDEILNVFAGASGSFSTQYTPLAIPGRYKITATDGTSSATTAVTEADAVNIDIEQCRNDSASATPTANCISSNGGVG